MSVALKVSGEFHCFRTEWYHRLLSTEQRSSVYTSVLRALVLLSIRGRNFGVLYSQPGLVTSNLRREMLTAQEMGEGEEGMGSNAGVEVDGLCLQSNKVYQ